MGEAGGHLGVPLGASGGTGGSPRWPLLRGSGLRGEGPPQLQGRERRAGGRAWAAAGAHAPPGSWERARTRGRGPASSLLDTGVAAGSSKPRRGGVAGGGLGAFGAAAARWPGPQPGARRADRERGDRGRRGGDVCVSVSCRASGAERIGASPAAERTRTMSGKNARVSTTDRVIKGAFAGRAGPSFPRPSGNGREDSGVRTGKRGSPRLRAFSVTPGRARAGLSEWGDPVVVGLAGRRVGMSPR